MASEYVIENGAESGCYLYKVEDAGDDRTCFYRPQIEDAKIFNKKAEAVAFAKRWHAAVWLVKHGLPKKRVWPV